jgi:hypothetical protein
MRITGTSSSLPLNIAKAYGVKPAATTRPTDGTSPIASIAPARKPDSFQSSSVANPLVAARVSQKVNFDSAAAIRPVQSAAPALPMYTRAADKMEAAVAVQIGRTLDVTG